MLPLHQKNPLVSTLYAIYNKTVYGKSSVLIGRVDDLSFVKVLKGEQQLKHDREVALDLLPSEFANVAREISTENASKILRGMGFDFPTTLKDPSQLDRALKDVPDFTTEQVAKFIKEVNKLSNKNE